MIIMVKTINYVLELRLVGEIKLYFYHAFKIYIYIFNKRILNDTKIIFVSKNSKLPRGFSFLGDIDNIART